MIRQQFDIDYYWRVVVYYNVDYNFFGIIANELKEAGLSLKNLHILYIYMKSGYAKAVTYSDLQECISIVVFNKHDSEKDYINSLVHEAEHIKQAMLEAYSVEDKGEPPAYTIGYLVERMWSTFKKLLT